MTSHFFGAVVLDEPVKDGQITTHEVIDGQQRLTTTLLFLAAATRLCENHGRTSHASAFESCGGRTRTSMSTGWRGTSWRRPVRTS